MIKNTGMLLEKTCDFLAAKTDVWGKDIFVLTFLFITNYPKSQERGGATPKSAEWKIAQICVEILLKRKVFWCQQLTATWWILTYIYIKKRIPRKVKFSISAYMKTLKHLQVQPQNTWKKKSLTKPQIVSLNNFCNLSLKCFFFSVHASLPKSRGRKQGGGRETVDWANALRI